jgi:predicted ATPase
VAIKFGLSNFKGFKKLEPIELKPLTVLCGINNSGKSSIIQSLLLMKQNVDSRQITSDYMYISDPIIFNGFYVHLGDWNDVIYGHATDKQIGLTWHIFDINQSKKDIEVDVKFGISSNININDKSTASEDKNKVLISNFIFRDLQNDFSFALEKSDNEFYQLKLRGIELRFFFLRLIYKSIFIYGDDLIAATNKAIKTKFFSQTLISDIVLEKVKVKFDGIAPTSLQIHDFAKQSHTILTQIKNEDLNNIKGVPKSFYHFLDLTLRHLNTYLQQKSTSEKTTSKNIREVAVRDELTMFTQEKEISLFDFFPFYRLTASYLRNLWSKMRYIGPLREAPKRFYLFDDWRKIDIGINGEYTPLVLAVEQEQKIPKYHRCIYEGKQIKEYELRESDQLLEALNWWLSECMKLPEITSVVGLSGIPGQVKLNSSGIDVNLPDVGFGVSQILPILVECLRTREDETVVLEQPEIHLHPSLQSKLADFLICMAKSGKRLVVETHSEHLINRLCLRIAQEESGEIKDLLNTLFVSFDGKEQTSVVKPIEINEFGEIENWPVGFFDENDARELMAASLKKRMAKSKK